MNNPSNRKPLAIVNMVAFLIVITANALANALPLNGQTTGQISDKYPNLFTPAGVTFSIWGVIYFFLAGFIVYQAIILWRSNHPAANKIMGVSPWFIGNSLLNASWIFAWHYNHVVLSFIIITGMLISAIVIHNKLKLSYSWQNIPNKLWIDIPFSLYLGWLSIATIANFTVVLTYLHRSGFASPQVWTLIMLSIGTLLSLIMIYRCKNVVYALVSVWAFYGIFLKRQALPGEESSAVIRGCLVCMGLIVLAILALLFSKKPATLTPASSA